MRIGQLADRLEAAGDRLATGAGALSDADPGAGAFGADAVGRMGDVGRMLYHRWGGALTARAREAAAHGARLTDTADAVRSAAERYRETDRMARSAHDLGAEPNPAARPDIEAQPNLEVL
jgi:hypothetical protein